MVKITRANKQHIPLIRELSEEIWAPTFAPILTKQQIAYMMEMMYSPSSLNKQMSSGHEYIVAQRDKENVGYLSYELNCGESGKTKIHKLYILPQHQRGGVGKAMVDYVAQQALQANNSALYLNVNKHNDKAIGFYKKHHFVLAKEEVIDIGKGFVMDDYVFELPLR